MEESENTDLLKKFRERIYSHAINSLSMLIQTDVEITLTARGIPVGSESDASEKCIFRRGRVVSTTKEGDLWLWSDDAEMEFIPRFNIAYITVINVSPEHAVTKKTSAPRVASTNRRPKQF